MDNGLLDNNRVVTKNLVREINLKEIVQTLKGRLWVILLSTVILTVAGGYYSSIPEEPLYSATTRIIISADSPEMLSTQKVFIREPIVIGKVIEALNLKRSIGGLRNQIRIGAVDGSLITLVNVTDSDPRRAVAIVNEVVNVYKQQTAATFNFSGVKVLSLAEDTEYPVPINPQSKRALYIGFFAGIALGVGLVFLLDSLDDSIRSKRDIEQLLGLNMLGHVSKISKKEVKQSNKRKSNPSIRGESIGA